MPFLNRKNKVSNSVRLQKLSERNGLRHAVFTVQNDKYVGEWKDNKKEGKGSLLTRSSKLYEGDWSNGYRHGFGLLAYKDDEDVYKLSYRGLWKNGRMCGAGSFHYPDGSYYLGNRKKGHRHGYGQMWYKDGSFYDGHWYQDNRQGLGLFVRPDGKRYEGSWKNDMKHGKGRFFHLHTGQMQEGVWHNDVSVYCTIEDIPFRQASTKPTQYPIQNLELVNTEEICDALEEKTLAEKPKSCLNLITPEPSIIHDTI